MPPTLPVSRPMRAARFAALLASTLIALAVPGFARAQGGAGIDLAGVGHDRGGDHARVYVIEFGDFGCGYCAKFVAETYPQIDSAYIRTGIVKWKFVPFVTGNFRHSREVSVAAECAAEQDAFWKMHDLLYSHRTEWMGASDVQVVIARYVRDLKLDASRFSTCARGITAARHIEHNTLLATTLNIRGTPTFFVNGQVIPGAIPFDLFRKVIEAASR